MAEQTPYQPNYLANFLVIAWAILIDAIAAFVVIINFIPGVGTAVWYLITLPLTLTAIVTIGTWTYFQYNKQGRPGWKVLFSFGNVTKMGAEAIASFLPIWTIHVFLTIRGKRGKGALSSLF